MHKSSVEGGLAAENYTFGHAFGAQDLQRVAKECHVGAQCSDEFQKGVMIPHG